MFKIIEFPDSSVAVIREEWMTPRKRQCLWPPHKISAKFNKCLTNQVVPDDSWPVHQISRILYETDDLAKANKKCKQAETDSELATDAESTSTGRKRKKLRTIYSDDDDDEINERNVNLGIPSPPGNPQNGTPSSRSCSTIHEDNSTIQEDNNSTIQEDNSTIQEYNSILTATPTTAKVRHGTSPDILEKINSSLDSIAVHLSKIKYEMKEMNEAQNEILLRVSTSSIATTNLPIELPMNSVDGVKNVEKWLEEDKENKNILINNLKYVGGKGTSTITRRILERLFTNSLAFVCNWTGKNNKFSLKQLSLVKVIIEAVRANKTAETASDSDITNVIRSWFRFARDRDGGRENRRKPNSN